MLKIVSSAIIEPNSDSSSTTDDVKLYLLSGSKPNGNCHQTYGFGDAFTRHNKMTLFETFTGNGFGGKNSNSGGSGKKYENSKPT